jgi:hypothetical protein
MCKSAIHPFLAALPKCEHHAHLEGTLSPDLEFELAKKNNIGLPQDGPAFKSPESLLERYTHFTSVDDFLHYYSIGISVLITASDFQQLALHISSTLQKMGSFMLKFSSIQKSTPHVAWHNVLISLLPDRKNIVGRYLHCTSYLYVRNIAIEVAN